jgi:hypothetical protein
VHRSRREGYGDDREVIRSTKFAWRTNGKRVSCAQRLPPNCDDDHAKYLSQKARVFGVGWTRGLGGIVSPIQNLVFGP